MADIKQAAIWMREGKSIRRKPMPSWIIALSSDGDCDIIAFVGKTESSAEFETSDLLAEDWEIAE